MRESPACVTAIPLGRRLPGASSNLPGRPGLDTDPEVSSRLHAKSPAPSLFGLAPGGVCRAAGVAVGAVRSYRTVSPLLRPLPFPSPKPEEGTLLFPPPVWGRVGWGSSGLFSVALSLGSRPPDVIRHRLSMEPGLSSPALPERPSGRLTRTGMGTLAAAVKRRLIGARRVARKRAPAPRCCAAGHDGRGVLAAS